MYGFTIVGFQVEQTGETVGRLGIVFQVLVIGNALHNGVLPLYFCHSHLAQPRVGIATPVAGFHFREHAFMLILVCQRYD